MNPDWNTPPGGDFVRYVEQLTARALATAARSGGAVLLGDDDATPPPVAARVLEPPRPVAAKKQPDAVAPKRSAHLGLKLLIGWAIVVGLFASGHAGLWTLALFAAALWFVGSRFKRLLTGFAETAKAEARRRQAGRGKLPG
ncbi:hypothetical protein [Xenophilus azovorans]|uniref:hypothetical protein n=1 Tax=Xenophilus azovorans TaxID=151755 RepID=UPI00056DDA07|nr:hypothetical protein [Xenophilus azovorans]